MPAAAVHLRVNGQRSAAYFSLERSIWIKGQGPRKLWIKYLGKIPKVPSYLEEEYSIRNSYSWLLSKSDSYVKQFLENYKQKRQRMKEGKA